MSFYEKTSIERFHLAFLSILNGPFRSSRTPRVNRLPHQGARECARRVRQMAAGILPPGSPL
jgi:hypothetical protein